MPVQTGKITNFAVVGSVFSGSTQFGNIFDKCLSNSLANARDFCTCHPCTNSPTKRLT